jgi:hypothetical protein
MARNLPLYQDLSESTDGYRTRKRPCVGYRISVVACTLPRAKLNQYLFNKQSTMDSAKSRLHPVSSTAKPMRDQRNVAVIRLSDSHSLCLPALLTRPKIKTNQPTNQPTHPQTRLALLPHPPMHNTTPFLNPQPSNNPQAKAQQPPPGRQVGR